MKNVISSINLPFLLLLSYSTYFIYLVQIGTAISIPLSLVFVFLVLLYCFNLYMIHIKKPEPHKLLEEKWASYNEEVEKKLEIIKESTKREMQILESKIVKVDLTAKLLPKVNKGGNNVW